jgi:integrase
VWLELKPRGLPDRYRIKSFGLNPSTTLPLSSEALRDILPTSSAGSWNRCLSLILAIHGIVGISASPIERRPMPKGRTRWLTEEEWKRLQKVLLEESPLLEQAARFTLATGLRENNVLELEWSQVDLGRRVAWFYADQMKGRAEHGIPLNDAALAVLRERKGIHKRWVFGNPDYPLYKASNRAWYNALRRSKLKSTGVVWHTLRHTWASWAVMSGVRLEEVMKLGGWKTYSMVLRYAHLAPEHMAEAASKVRPVSRLRHKGSLAQR